MSGYQDEFGDVDPIDDRNAAYGEALEPADEPLHDELDGISAEVSAAAARAEAVHTGELLARAAAERGRAVTGPAVNDEPILLQLWIDPETAAAIGQTRYGQLGAARCETGEQLVEILRAHYLEAGAAAISYSAASWRTRIDQVR